MKIIFSILFLLSWSYIFAQTPPFTIEAFYSKPDEVTVCIHNHSDREMRISAARFAFNPSDKFGRGKVKPDSSEQNYLPKNDSLKLWIKIPSQRFYSATFHAKDNARKLYFMMEYTFHYAPPPTLCWEEYNADVDIMPSRSYIKWNMSRERLAPVEKLSGDTVYAKKVDVPAQYPGGVNALYMHLREETNKYISKFNWDGISYRAYVHFIIEKDGSVSHISPFLGIGTTGGDDLNKRVAQATIDVVQSLPKFTPAQVKGKPVRSSLVIVVIFYAP